MKIKNLDGPLDPTINEISQNERFLQYCRAIKAYINVDIRGTTRLEVAFMIFPMTIEELNELLIKAETKKELDDLLRRAKI